MYRQSKQNPWPQSDLIGIVKSLKHIGQSELYTKSVPVINLLYSHLVHLKKYIPVADEGCFFLKDLIII